MFRTASLLLIWLVFLKADYLFSQNNLRFTHYTTRDGLSNNIVTALFQDSRGLLWIGTSNGLNYFDGVSFQSIYPTDFDKVHLHSDGVTQLAEDAKGNIFLTTDDGVEEYNWETKTLRLIFSASINEHSYEFKIDRQKNIWLLSEKYLQKYNPKLRLRQSILLDTLKNKIINNGGFHVTFCSIDNANNIWFSYHDLLCKWDVSKNILESKFNNVYHKKIFNYGIASMAQDKKGYYWFILSNKTPPNGLVRYSLNSNLLCVYPSKSNLSVPLTISSSGKILISSYNDGLNLFDTTHHLFNTIYSYSANTNTPADDVFDQIYEDKNGNIWLGTSHNGLDKCTDLSNNFKIMDKFGYEDPQTHHIKISIDDIMAYKKDLFVCTSEGFFKINTQNFYTQSFRYNKKKHSQKDYYWINLNIDTTSLLASTLKGIRIYSLNDKKLQPVSFPFKHPAILDSVTTVAAFQDLKKDIWLSLFGGNGIYCWNRKKNSFLKYDAQQTGKNYFPLRHFSCAAEDDNGNIWMGYDKNGLTIFDTALQKFVQPSLAAFAQLNNNSIHEILNDHRNNLWLSTSKGLYCYSQKTNQVKQYNRTDGLISNIVTGMAFDKKGILWIANYSGLSRFDTSTKQFTNFTTTDGLPAEQIYKVIYDSVINKICCITDYAVILFDPSKLNKIRSPLSPVITSFYVMGKQRSLNEKINLSAKENFFSFNYTAANFVNATDTRYEYRLDGFNKTWVNAGKRQYAGYTNLDGGNYTFKVRASTDGIRWYEMRAPLLIHIETPFYKTIWFYILLSVTIIIIIAYFFYAAYRTQLKRILLAQKIRNEIASDLHDDVGSSLSSIMLMSEIAKKTHENTENYFNAIKENAGKIIENMNDIVWAVNPNNDTMEQLLIRMQSFASSLLEKKNIMFKFIAADALASIKINMEERKNFYLIFKEAVHNIFKYAECNSVITQIKQQDRNILMIIKDNGKGFDTKIKYTGNGLKNIATRSKAINGKLEIISGLNEGTTITLAFKPTHKGS